jgi:flagellar biosynthetic protein FliO
VRAVVLGVLAAQAQQVAAPGDVPGGYGQYLLTSLLVLALVCALAWVALRFGLRRLFPAARVGADGPIKVVARAPLDGRQALYIVEVGGKTLLVGAGDRPLTTLAELDAQAVAEAVAAAPRPTTFAEVLRRITGKREPEEKQS